MRATGIGLLIEEHRDEIAAAWRRASLRSLSKTFVIPFAVAVVTGVVLLALGFGSSLPGLLTYTFSAFVAASIVLEFVRGRGAAGGIAKLISRNRRRYGGYIVHAAVVLLAIGIAGSSAYQTQREQILRPGQSMEAAGYTLTYTGLTGVKGSNYTGYRAQLAVSGHGERFRLDPGANHYFIEGVERGVHLPRSALDRGRLHDGAGRRGPHDQHRPQGLRQAARQPDLGRRVRLRRRRADRHVARRGRAAAPRRTLCRGRCAGGNLKWRGRSPSRP